MYILILGESSTRGLPNKHGLLSSQLIRQPTAPTSAHTTTEIVLFLFFLQEKNDHPCTVTKTKPTTPRFRMGVWRDPDPGAPIMRSPPPVGVEGPSVRDPGARPHLLPQLQHASPQPKIVCTNAQRIRHCSRAPNRTTRALKVPLKASEGATSVLGLGNGSCNSQSYAPCGAAAVCVGGALGLYLRPKKKN